MAGVTLPDTYVLLFHDEFNRPGIQNDPTWLVPFGTSIGNANWSGGQPNNEFETDGANIGPGVDGYPYSTDLGYLTLSWFQLSPRNGGQLMASVDPTYTGFSVRHGYFELKFKLPQVQPGPGNTYSGLWPAFWLQSIGRNAQNIGPEIDIFEGYSVDPTGNFPVLITSWHLWGPNGQVDALGHKFDTQGGNSSDLGYQPPPGTPGFADGWNTVGLLVDAQNITAWVNGVQYWQTPNPDDTAMGLPLFILLDTAYGGGWPTNFSWGVPPFPGAGGQPPVYLFNIGYVRAWGDPAQQ